MSRDNPPQHQKRPNGDPVEAELRRSMRARWDPTPVPANLAANVQARFHQAARRRRIVRLATSLVTGMILLALITGFAALLQNRSNVPLDPAPGSTATVSAATTTPQALPSSPSVESTGTAALTAFTTPHPILSDLRVRQAVAYCTNRPELVRSVYPWAADPSIFEADSFIARDHWAYVGDDPDFVRYPFDPDKGRALLEAAGWTLSEGAAYRTNAAGSELALTLTTTDADFRKTWDAVFEEQMKACGVRLTRNHTPAAWLFGDSTGLNRREFEIAAFAWVVESDPDGRGLYACDQIPRPENNWQGQNFTGWCNALADQAIRAATSTLDRETRREAYRTVQEELSHDLPFLPLFNRAEFYAAHPALENFMPDVSEPFFTWNAAQWRLPGKDTIVIGERSEPATLAAWESAHVTQLLRRLIMGVDYTTFNYDHQPVMLKHMPTVESGAAVNTVVDVAEGAGVVNAAGEAAVLRPGVVIRTADGIEVEFTGGAARMNQLVVTYEFVDGLTWSDGTLISMADYELAYRVMCDAAINPPGELQPFPACNWVDRVEFVSDTVYTVLWKPGYQNPAYVEPPIGRQPAHQVMGDGRRLADVPPSQWPDLDEVNHKPLSIGPYVLDHWEFGREIVFKANPYFYQGPPATPNVVVRFIPQPDTAAHLINGQVDVLGFDSLLPEHIPALMEAQQAGRVRAWLLPSGTYEHLDFALYMR